MLIFISFDKIYLICICLLHSAFLTLLLSWNSLHPTLHFNFQKLARIFFHADFISFDKYQLTNVRESGELENWRKGRSKDLANFYANQLCTMTRVPKSCSEILMHFSF
jgi:hypothetical protein